MKNKVFAKVIGMNFGVVVSLLFYSCSVCAESFDPLAADYTGNQGKKIYVSRLGDNSDGSSWAKAFHTIAAGMKALPDDKGGHQVIVRPDTYLEANIDCPYKGAKGSYNVLVGDWDGQYGSGTTGWVIIDSSDPEKGFKAVDYWGTFLTSPSHATVGDRWIFRNIYTTGAEGHGWDIGPAAGSDLTVRVEHCVAIGRFSGIMMAAHVSRKEEPTLFRDSFFMCLDWWVDAGSVYFRAHNPAMPEFPDATFENCTMVGPDNAVQVGFPGFQGYNRLKFKNCRMIVTNFSQPRGTPSTGVVCTDLEGKYLHVDFEDCFLMGFKLFGFIQDPFSYTTRGKCQGYVQYEQSVPDGFKRVGAWPAEVFKEILLSRFHGKK